LIEDSTPCSSHTRSRCSSSRMLEVRGSGELSLQIVIEPCIGLPWMSSLDPRPSYVLGATSSLALEVWNHCDRA
jgi:hypothetical protein